MSLLLGLPQDLIRTLISEWLKDASLRTLVVLDIATATHPNYSEFEEALSCSELIYDIRNTNAFAWLRSRKVNICEIALICDIFEGFRGRDEKVLYDSIFSVINSFKSLSSIEFMGFGFLLTRIDRTVLSHITSLSIERSMDDDIKSIQYIKENCFSLKTLSLGYYCFDSKERMSFQTLMCDIVAQNTNLVDVTVSDVEDCSILRKLMQCKGLTIVKLTSQRTDMDLVNQFVNNVPTASLWLRNVDYRFVYDADKDLKLLTLDDYGDRDNLKLLKKIKNLQHLRISFNTTLADLHVVQSYCSSTLTSFDLTCSGECDKSIVYVLENFPRLERLCVFGRRTKKDFHFDFKVYPSPTALTSFVTVGIGFTFLDAISIIKACPALTSITLNEDIASTGYYDFVDFIVDFEATTGRTIKFNYVDSSCSESLLKYENKSFSGMYWEEGGPDSESDDFDSEEVEDEDDDEDGVDDYDENESDEEEEN